MSDQKVISCVKLELVWVSFLDKEGIKHDRLLLRNPAGRSLLWDVGADRSTAAPIGAVPFEEQENLKVERMDNMTLMRAPEWLEGNISKILKDSDHFVAEDSPQKSNDKKAVDAATKAAAIADKAKKGKRGRPPKDSVKLAVPPQTVEGSALKPIGGVTNE